MSNVHELKTQKISSNADVAAKLREIADRLEMPNADQVEVGFVVVQHVNPKSYSTRIVKFGLRFLPLTEALGTMHVAVDQEFQSDE